LTGNEEGPSLPADFHTIAGDGLVIRSTKPADLPSLLRLLDQMHEGDAPLVANDHLRDVYADIARSRSRLILIAVLDEEIVGTLDLFVMPNLTRAGRPWAGVENLVVAESHRRRGIGDALMQSAISLASQAGCYKVQLVSHAKRDAAHELYRSTGFTAPVRGYRRYL